METCTHSTRRTAAGAVAALVIALISSIGLSPTVSAAAPSHLDWALDVALNVTPDNNEYASSSTYVTWPGVKGSKAYSNRSDCSAFVRRVLNQAYRLSSKETRRWMGDSTPNAALYHDTIVAENRFTRILNVTDIAAGDLLAAKYLSPSSTASGHTMFAAGPAVERTASSPVIADTTQYELQIVDSARSGHGPNDTRRNSNQSWEDGVGVGVMRIYADADGAIVGYTWSTWSNSVFHGASTRPIAVGRLD